MKSIVQEVLSPVTLSGVTSYSSGTLDVATLNYLAMDVEVTAFSAAGSIKFTVSRISLDNQPYELLNAGLTFTSYGGAWSTQKMSANVGPGLISNGTSYTFGEQIQIDMEILSGSPTIDAVLSVYGK